MKCVAGMRQQGEQGSTMTEAALVMPVMFLIIAGIIQYGYVFGALITLRNASAVAARAAVLSNNPSMTSVCDAAENSISPMLDPNQLTCATNPTTLPVSSSTPVTVTLTYPIPIIISYPGLQSGPTWSLTVQTTMQ